MGKKQQAFGNKPPEGDKSVFPLRNKIILAVVLYLLVIGIPGNNKTGKSQDYRFDRTY